MHSIFHTVIIITFNCTDLEFALRNLYSYLYRVYFAFFVEKEKNKIFRHDSFLNDEFDICSNFQAFFLNNLLIHSKL